jgi:hypothetical protein
VSRTNSDPSANVPHLAVGSHCAIYWRHPTMAEAKVTD